MDVIERDNKRRRLIVAVACAVASLSKRDVVHGRLPNRTTAEYDRVVKRILTMRDEKPNLFTRMYRLSPSSFDKVLAIIKPQLLPRKKTAKYFVPPLIKLCLGLRVLAGGSYLDLSFGYDVPHSTVHFYAWQALHAIDQSTDPFLDNIKSPTRATEEEREKLEHGFAELSNFKLRGTVAAGDGVVFRMQMPTVEEVEGDVTSYFTRKGYYAFGLQAFCDSKCRFVMISSKLCSSTNDNTTFIVMQLSKDIKAGKLPSKYHVVLDEAYLCTDQETSPWKGRNLSVEKDACNYYLSLNRQVIERAFGLLVQRRGIFWRPLRLSMLHRGVAVRVACRLHNICVDDFGLRRMRPVGSGCIPGFEHETDHQHGDSPPGIIAWTDGTAIRVGYRSDLEQCNHRDMWTNSIKQLGLTRPNYSKFSKKIVRK